MSFPYPTLKYPNYPLFVSTFLPGWLQRSSLCLTRSSHKKDSFSSPWHRRERGSFREDMRCP